MRSTKLCLITSALALAFALPGNMAAQNGQATLDGGVMMWNASTCPAKTIIYAPGSTKVDFHQNDSHVTVHVLFHNDGADTSTNDSYRLNLEGMAQDPEVLTTLDQCPSLQGLDGGVCYAVPYHSVWVSQGGGSNFTMDGIDHVVVVNGNPVRSNLATWDVCPPQ